jgi:hypothetical protein
VMDRFHPEHRDSTRAPNQFSQLKENPFWNDHDECELKVHRIHA